MPPSHNIVDRFSTHLKNVLTRALVFAVENEQPAILSEHLLWALGTERGGIGAELLEKLGVKTGALRALATQANAPSAMKPAAQTASPQLSEDAKRAIEKAVLTANAHEHRYVGTEHLLAGLIQARVSALESFFTNQGVDRKELSEHLAAALHGTSRFPDIATSVDVPPGAEPVPAAAAGREPSAHLQALEAFGRELTAKEEQPKLDPVVGREREIERVMEILCRRTKNNPLLMGEPGVGKTAIVEGLARRIHAGDVPPALRGRRIISVDLASMIAGTMYRGEFEQRIRLLIEETRRHPDIVLFIDEIHTVVGAGAATGSLDAANILKPALARGDLRCIGATTPAEFKRHIESDAALERRFQPVTVDEPTPERTLDILRGLSPAYEDHHHVRYAPEALEAAVRLSLRFLQDRRLPDKAIDLMDEAGAAVRVRSRTAWPSETRRNLEQRIADAGARKQEAVAREHFDEATACRAEEEGMRRTLARAAKEAKEDARPFVDARGIASVVSRLSGLSLEDVLHEATDPNALEAALSARVFGQSSAVATVARAIARAKAGLNDRRRPLASFLFVGPSGVGKTELAKAVAEAAFHDERACLRLDMSEYAESFTASKLVGAPAGYVGYKDGAALTDRLRQRPHSVLLFDEADKAHPDVQHLLLQMLEEGEISDASGLPVSVRNAVLILTSNAGLDTVRRGPIGFAAEGATAEDVRRELEEWFRPELLHRIDHILPFAPLSAEALRAVAAREMERLARRLAERGRALSFDAQVSAFLAERADVRSGARDIRRLVQTLVEDRLAEWLGSRSTAFSVDVEGGDVRVKAS